MKKPHILLGALAFALMIVGCNSGTAPAGSETAAKSEYDALSKEKKIEFWERSSLPAVEKAAKLKELGVDNPNVAPPVATGAGK